MKKTKTKTITANIIENKILLIRDKKVMFDKNLAELYGVETRELNQAVKRNIERFPSDFMFQLTEEEMKSLRSQFVTLKRGQHRKYKPYVFTEHGALMAANVIKSKTAIEASIAIVRTFIKLREMMMSYKELEKKIEAIEKKYNKHDQHFQIIFKTIQKMLNSPIKKNVKIGF